MADSDSEYTDCDDDSDIQIMHFMGDYQSASYSNPCTPAWISATWNSLPAYLKKDAAHLMRLSVFWLQLLLLNDGTSNIVQWAKRHGCDPTDLSIGTLRKIEILEAILLALESGTCNDEQTHDLIMISAMFRNPAESRAHDAALRWLTKIAAPELKSHVMSQTTLLLSYSSLRVIFRDYANFILKMAKYTDLTMEMLRSRTPGWQIEASNHLKNKGNELFQKQKYEDAVHIYSKAIKHYPENHVIFGNRALCYIRCKKYIEAAFDGKRAILLEPLWVKGHYRYCEALFLLGEEKKAMVANSSAQNLCKNNPEGVQELTQQHKKFVGAMIGNKSNKVGPPEKGKGSSNADANKKFVAEQQHLLKAKGGSSNKSKVVPGAASPCKAAECKTKKENQQVKEKAVPPVPASITKEPGTPKKTRPTPAAAVKPPSTPKKTMAPLGASTTKQPNTLKKKDQGPENHAEQQPKQPVAINKAAVCKELRSLVHDAHTALSNLCSYNAEMAFSQALALLDTVSHKDMGLSTLDVQLLLYGRVSALTDIGKPEEIAEAQRLLEKIKSYEERIFQCLVCYARGRLYLKENRFAVAQKHFEDSLQMVKNRITPGILTWPLSKEIVKETQLNYFKKLLEDSIALCKFPPIPDATCRLGKCMSSSKNIYFTDPDFKGFIQIKCSQQCLIEYHTACWKTLKTSLSFEKNEKDFLEQPCRTPDCFGQVCSIKIVDPTGLVKCKFERDIPKPQTQKKPKVDQKCSIRVKKSKEESQLKTKNINNNKQLCDEKVTISEDILPAKDNNSVLQSQQKAWLLYGDRILVQVCQMMRLLRQEKGLSVSTLSTYLRPWLELDSARGNQLATKMLNWEEEQLETLDQAVELLLERKNRVWARVFIELLSKSFDISVELSQWASRLNDADLNAAKSFIKRNAHQMEDWDVTVLLTFAPLRETISESVVTSQEFIAKNGLSKYLGWAAPHEMRLFIWTLAELKDRVTCNLLLNEYFDMIDGHYSVLKKSDQNSYPVSVKNPGRKRKKGLNSLPVWRQSFAPIDHGDQENPIYYLQPSDPFRIPSHLQAEVAEFEDQYNGPRHKTDLKKLLDNNPDPTEENMYDYFAQILEGHGPLLPDSPLLIDEMENFPPMAHAKIDKAGGFEAFLLESLRFIKIGMRVGLAKHAVSLQQQQHPLEAPYIISSPQTEEPHPYSVDPYPSPTNHLPVGTDDLLRPVSRGQVSYWDDPKFSLDDFDWMELHAAEKEDAWETHSYSSESNATPTEEIVAVKHSETQTCPVINDSVAINTEPLKRYESFHGDVNKKAKCINEMKEKMNKMANDREEVEQKHNEGLESLQREIQEITVNIQVTDKELTLFQQKLEEEIKKDQKEKKANQEVLKALKLETEQLVEEQASLTKTIKQKKASFKEELDTFLELSNQSAAEKVSLEDEVKRCKATVAMATKRYRTAQLCILESNRDQRLHSLHRQLAEAKALLGKLDENVQRFPSLETNRQTWRTNVQDLEKKIATVETQYKEQTEQVKSGKRAKDVLSNSGQPEPQVSMLSTDMAALSTASAETRNPTKPATPASNTVFDKAMERLATVFPNYTRSDFMRFFKDLRSSNGGSLNGMGWQEVVSGVGQLILKHQEMLKSGAASKTTELEGAQGDSNTSVWKRFQPQNPQDTTVLNLEDPCVICQEDIHPADHCVLECRHGFHKKCIMLWLKETSNCPTCRKHTLMSDFPLLVGRRRQAP